MLRKAFSAFLSTEANRRLKMKFLILLAVVAAASAVPYFPYTHTGYGGYGYGHDLVTDNIDYRTLMMGGRTHILDKDITLVKKDFIIFYYKYLVDLLDIFKTRFNDILVHVDYKDIDTIYMPLYCKKMTGLTRWMMTMNIDFTKYDPHFFDLFMVCKVTDYMMFMKYYWLHFNYVDVMHKDLPFMRDIFQGFGDHTGFLHKFGDYYGKHYDGVYGKQFGGVYGKQFGGVYGPHYDGIYGNDFVGHKYTPYGYGYNFNKVFPVKDFVY